jgi:hypothetical protein
MWIIWGLFGGCLDEFGMTETGRMKSKTFGSRFEVQGEVVKAPRCPISEEISFSTNFSIVVRNTPTDDGAANAKG